jgi:F0F1-type ATP synthase epsilon subunit
MPNEVAKLYINIRSRGKIFYESYYDAITSTNDVGPFDILPFHSNFICLINDFIYLWQDEKKVVDMKISKGILKVQNNRVLVFLDV